MIETKQQKLKYNIPPELKEIIPGYLGRRDQDILQLRKAVDQSDFDTIAKIAHKLKGNGASYGFDNLTEIGQKLMQVSEIKNQVAAKTLIHELHLEVENIKFNIF